MKAVSFDPNIDMPEINKWLRMHEHKEVNREDLPKIGFIVYSHGVGVAAAFLRTCEGNVAIVDGLCSNPMMAGETRHEALDLVILSCVQAGKDIGIKHFLGYTRDEKTLERSIRLGFVEVPYKIVSLSLTKD